MKRIISAVLTGIFSLSLNQVWAQYDFVAGGSIYESLANSAIAVPAVPSTSVSKEVNPLPKKKWTVMVYANAKNNLEAAGLLNVNMMEMIGSDDNINVVVELGRMNGQEGDYTEEGNWTGSKRIYVTKDDNMEQVVSPVVMTTPQVDMGDSERAVDFVSWAKKMYPADRYLFILWNHGSGFMDPNTGDKGISFDDETGNYIRTAQIGEILKKAGKVDVLAFDACVMQMAEVASEVKDYADVMVGSEEVTPGVGIPYHMVLSYLADKPDTNAEELGMVMAECFKLFYEQEKEAVQQSALRLSKMAGFEKLMKEFTTLAIAADAKQAMAAAKSGAMRFDIVGEEQDLRKTISFYGDLYGLLESLAARLIGGDDKAMALKGKAEEVMRFIDNELIIHNAFTGRDRLGRSYADAHGISVYMAPARAGVSQNAIESNLEGPYSDLIFAKATGWHDFVTTMYQNAYSAKNTVRESVQIPRYGAPRR